MAEEKLRHETRMAVHFSGIPVGEATFNLEIEGTKYLLRGKGKTRGMADLVSPGKGNFTSAGEVKNDKIIAKNHTLRVEEIKKKKKASVDMVFAGNKVADLKLNPDKRARRSKSSKYVHILPEHMTAVIDPASSLVIPVAAKSRTNGREICGRTFKIFDGETRYDMALSYKGTRQVTAKGYKGAAYVCKLKYKPIAGHKKTRKNVKRMAKNENMEIWLAPVADTGLFTPIRIEVGTWVGTFSAQAERFETLAAN